MSGRATTPELAAPRTGPDPSGTSWWIPATALAAAVAGLAVSMYLTVAHYTSASILACSSRGAVNCERVTTSAQSELFGIPVAVLGMVWFAAMIALDLPRAWRANATVARTRIAVAGAGIVFVLYLVYAELFEIHAICLWCTAAHVLAFVVFVLALAGVDTATKEDRDRT